MKNNYVCLQFVFMPKQLPERGLVVVVVELDPDGVVLHQVRIQAAPGKVLGQVTLGIRVDGHLDGDGSAVYLEDRR